MRPALRAKGRLAVQCAALEARGTQALLDDNEDETSMPRQRGLDLKMARLEKRLHQTTKRPQRSNNKRASAKDKEPEPAASRFVQNHQEAVEYIQKAETTSFASPLARDLLETLDVFRSAFDAEINNENYQEFVNGIKMTQESLNTALEKHGIKEVECLEKPFDPNTQEALSSEFKEGVPEGHVTQVFKAPYTYHDKLLRPGQVVVSRAKSE